MNSALGTEQEAASLLLQTFLQQGFIKEVRNSKKRHDRSAEAMDGALFRIDGLRFVEMKF